jgi:hypothetical protein
VRRPLNAVIIPSTSPPPHHYRQLNGRPQHLATTCSSTLSASTTTICTSSDTAPAAPRYASGGYATLCVRVTATAATGECLEVHVAASGAAARALPYATLALQLPPYDPRSFVGGAAATISYDD